MTRQNLGPFEGIGTGAWDVTVTDAENPDNEQVVTVYAESSTEAGVKARNIYAFASGERYDPERHKVVSVRPVAVCN